MTPVHINFGAVRIGARPSKLAQIQARSFAQLLNKFTPNVPHQLISVRSEHDESLRPPNVKGVFCATLEKRLRNREIDCAVHSLKDLPSDNPDDLFLSHPISHDPRDALVSPSSDPTPHDALVGSSSARRIALLHAHYPRFQHSPVRGNVPTRIQHMLEGRVHALLLANAGLLRLASHLPPHHAQPLPLEQFVPAPAQGIIAAQCLADSPLKPLLQSLDNPLLRARAVAERSFINALGAQCGDPVGAHAVVSNKSLKFHGVVFPPNSPKPFHIHQLGSPNDAASIAQRAAEVALRALHP